MIIELRNEKDILTVLDHFTPDLHTLASGAVDKKKMAEKFARFADVIAVEENGATVGFSAFYSNDGERRTAYLSMIAVDRNCRNGGIGKILINETVRRSKERGMEKLTLEVRKENLSAIGFYEHLGFSVCGENAESFLMTFVF